MISASDVKKKASELGFYSCGIASCGAFEKEYSALSAWLKKAYHSDMIFLAKNIDKRHNPKLLRKNIESVIVVLLNYGNSNYFQEKKSDYLFAEYALGKDYHLVMKEKLSELARFLQSHASEIETHCFVDTAPVFEKPFAFRAGLGWIGKNTLLVTPNGSKFFIGEIFTNITFDFDAPLTTNGCKNCDACLQACPTKALEEPYLLNTKKCLSYQTIERKEEKIDAFSATATKTAIYGCDICQQACPYNQKAENTNISEFAPKQELLTWSNQQWETISESDFNRIFFDSAVYRIGYQKFMENIRTAKLNLTSKR